MTTCEKSHKKWQTSEKKSLNVKKKKKKKNHNLVKKIQELVKKGQKKWQTSEKSDKLVKKMTN